MFVCDSCEIKVLDRLCPVCGRDREGLTEAERYKGRRSREVAGSVMGLPYVKAVRKKTPFPGEVKPGSVSTSRKIFSWQKKVTY